MIIYVSLPRHALDKQELTPAIRSITKWASDKKQRQQLPPGSHCACPTCKQITDHSTQVSRQCPQNAVETHQRQWQNQNRLMHPRRARCWLLSHDTTPLQQSLDSKCNQCLKVCESCPAIVQYARALLGPGRYMPALRCKPTAEVH